MFKMILPFAMSFYFLYYISLLNHYSILKNERFLFVNKQGKYKDMGFEDYDNFNNSYEVVDISIHLKNLGLDKLPESERELKNQYRKAAKKHHPDLGGDEDNFYKINKSYNILQEEMKKEG